MWLVLPGLCGKMSGDGVVNDGGRERLPWAVSKVVLQQNRSGRSIPFRCRVPGIGTPRVHRIFWQGIEPFMTIN